MAAGRLVPTRAGTGTGTEGTGTEDDRGVARHLVTRAGAGTTTTGRESDSGIDRRRLDGRTMTETDEIATLPLITRPRPHPATRTTAGSARLLHDPDTTTEPLRRTITTEDRLGHPRPTTTITAARLPLITTHPDRRRRTTTIPSDPPEEVPTLVLAPLPRPPSSNPTVRPDWRLCRPTPTK